MGNSISSRWEHFGVLWKEGVWTKWLGVSYQLACFFIFVRDELWHPKNPDQWEIINMIPHLSLAWWLVGTLTLLCAWVFEASFRAFRRLEDELIGLKIASKAPLSAVAEGLQILTGKGDDFDTRRPAGLYMTNHTFSVCVENGDPTQFRSNCELYLNIANQTDHGSKDYWLDGPFTLNPTEKRFRSIVSYLEPASVSQHKSDFIQLHIPIGQGYGLGHGWPWRLPLGAYAFALWASCPEAGRTELACKIWVDDGHKLHFEKA